MLCLYCVPLETVQGKEQLLFHLFNKSGNLVLPYKDF